MDSGARAGKSTPSGATEEMNSSATPVCRDPIQGIDRIRPFASAARLLGPAQTTGFPSTAKRLHLYICIPGLGYCFGPRRHRVTSVARYIATRLHAYRATRRRPAERREGRPRAPTGHAPIFERGAVGASRSASTGYRLINTNLTSRTNDKEAKLNRSRTETSKTLVFQSRTQPSTANKKNSSPIHSVTEEINFA